MRTCLSLLAALTVAAGSLSAQATSTNVFGISPNSTDATSRSGVTGPSTGDVLIEVRGGSFGNPANLNGATGADFVSVGDQGAAPHGTQGDGRCSGFQVTIQDQDASTTEGFDFCIVTEDGAAGALGNPASPPAPGNAVGPEVLLRTTSLTTPPGTGVAAWILTATFSAPADVIPDGLTEATAGAGNSTWYYGIGLSANALWTVDGASIHMSSFDGLGPPFPNAGDNPADGIVSIQQARDTTTGVVQGKSSSARTKEIFLLTEAPVLNPGAAIDALAQVGPDPCFGVAGNYPDSCGTGNTNRISVFGAAGYAGRAGVGDGYAVRLRAAADVGAPWFLMLSGGGVGGFSGTQVYLPFFDGAFVGNFAPLTAVPAGVIPASGEGILTLQTPSASQPLCPASGARMGAQAAILSTSLRFSNGASTLF